MDDVLIVDYGGDSKDHDKMPRQAVQICQKRSFKLNKEKCHFMMHEVAFL